MDHQDTELLEELRRGVEARIAERSAEEAEEEAPRSREFSRPPTEPSAADGEGMPIDWATEPAPAYANGLQLAYSAQDFALLFTEMTKFPGRLAPGNRVGQERARVAASLRLNPDVFFQMLCLMTSTWNQFVGEAVDPRMRQPKFKLLDAGDLQLRGLSEKQSGEA